MGIRRDTRSRFLEILAATGNVSRAAATSGISRGTLYAERERDSAFAAAWLEAIEAATDALEAEARRRAIEGVEVTVVQGGRLVHDDAGKPLTIRRYSDSLLALLLRAHRPEKYRDRRPIVTDNADSRGLSFTIKIGERTEEEQPGPTGKNDTSDC